MDKYSPITKKKKPQMSSKVKKSQGHSSSRGVEKWDYSEPIEFKQIMKTRRSICKRDDIEDDMTPEEIEMLFMKNDLEMKKSSKKVDPLIFSMYADDRTNNFEIEKRFRRQEDLLRSGVSPEEAARRVYVENATPYEIECVDAWLESNADMVWKSQSSDDMDFEEETFIDDEDVEVFGRRKSQKGREKKIIISVFSDIFHLERFGANVERWPIRIFSRTTPISAEALTQIASTEKMKNFIRISRKEYEVPEDIIYHKLDHITGKDIRKIVKENVDGLVIDPPLGIDGYSEEDFHELLRNIPKMGENPYIMIWVDPDTIETVNDVANKVKLEACDSVAVELFDSMMAPIELKTNLGFPQHTRMILMYRVKFSKRSSIAQQRLKDIGWGVVYPNGKSRRRFGMPQTAHDILEALLPANIDHRRFVELWPSRCHLRPRWISIDEQ